MAPVYLIAADARAGNYTLALGEELRSAFRSATPLEASYAETITPGDACTNRCSVYA